MPYFKWHGIDLSGTMRHGKLFARSQQELDLLLLRRDIALLRSSSVSEWFQRPIYLSHKIHFFKQLSVLIRSGVLLPDALDILVTQMNHVRFQTIIQEITQKVHNGVSLSQALQHYQVFDDLMIQIVHVGQETGSLASALAVLSVYLEGTYEFYKKMRMSLLIPLITIVFFVIVALAIFLIIIPTFAGIFESLNKDLPALTKVMLRISYCMRQKYVIVTGIGILSIVIVVWRRVRQKYSSRTLDGMLLSIPFLRKIIYAQATMHFLQALALLLAGGMQLVPSLRIARQVVHNRILQEDIECLESEVEAGAALNQAMIQRSELLFPPDLVSIVHVGEESGTLITMLEGAALTYRDKVQNLLTLLTTLSQPILMLFLGVLVGLLIFAVYLPILELSYSI